MTLPYLLLNYHPMTGTQILALLGAGLAAAGGQFGITAAYYHAPAKEISIYDYSQIIFSTILGFFLFGQVPGQVQCAWICDHSRDGGMDVLLLIKDRKKRIETV